MTTAEDVFPLYERSAGPCEVLLPHTIGDPQVPCSLKRKCYVRPGDECPICCDAIQTKRSAFVTPCGHAFHKACLCKYMETKWLSTKYTSNARCPLCRCSLGHPEFVQRYRSSYFGDQETNETTSHTLDKLEDFWIAFEFKLPYFCSHGYDHYLGMDGQCFVCRKYREKGELLYGF